MKLITLGATSSHCTAELVVKLNRNSRSTRDSATYVADGGMESDDTFSNYGLRLAVKPVRAKLLNQLGQVSN